MLLLQSLLIACIIQLCINHRLMTLPRPAWQRRAYPTRYMVTTPNRVDVQAGDTCAAFATAYVLRHFHVEAEGHALYAHFPSKTKTGTIYPKGIRQMLARYGFQTTYWRGTIHSLKHAVSQGTPVIVFMKTNNTQTYLHFTTVVGYDEHFIYFAESYAPLMNEETPFYNRRLTIEAFEQLWDTRRYFMLYYKNTYMTIQKNTKES